MWRSSSKPRRTASMCSFRPDRDKSPRFRQTLLDPFDRFQGGGGALAVLESRARLRSGDPRARDPARDRVKRSRFSAFSRARRSPSMAKDRSDSRSRAPPPEIFRARLIKRLRGHPCRSNPQSRSARASPRPCRTPQFAWGYNPLIGRQARAARHPEPRSASRRLSRPVSRWRSAAWPRSRKYGSGSAIRTTRIAAERGLKSR